MPKEGASGQKRITEKRQLTQHGKSLPNKPPSRLRQTRDQGPLP